MDKNSSSTSTISSIRAVNRDSGLSNNIMVYRLALLLEQHPFPLQSTTTLLTTERESLIAQLQTTLSQNALTVEDYRQTLKNKYYEEYLNKFGGVQQSQQDNSSRVGNLIEKKKQTFLQQMFSAGQHNLPLEQSSNYQSSDKDKEVIQPEPSSTQENETLKQSLIPAVMNTIMTMGKDTTNTGRVYNGIVYRLQLLFKEDIQFLNVNRKTDPPNAIAFSAYKDESNEFKITENNLSHPETLRIIAFDKQQRQQSQAQDNYKDRDRGSELGD
ncbi:hypothetical protein [Dendronalium sp. ChiSLP03b]|uniref:hypothetical protein n=1 Tax=Dendronalium sp. ChiSLP03b TaxID=3075381 RepID=UPI002AD3B473|nr:hypothetical protein [Dendronalium sp. ChiSLP03b]MDZ8203530.1 hypothetical protein [Dendronalium sp. ChiSLP03b]